MAGDADRAKDIIKIWGDGSRQWALRSKSVNSADHYGGSQRAHIVTSAAADASYLSVAEIDTAYALSILPDTVKGIQAAEVARTDDGRVRSRCAAPFVGDGYVWLESATVAKCNR